MVAEDKPKGKQQLSFHKKLLFHTIPYLVLLIVLIGIEAAVRLRLPHVPSIQVYVVGETHGDRHEGAQTFEGDPLLGWRLKSNLVNQWWDYTTFSTNSQHLRHPVDVKAKKPGTLRIVCLGDSVTFGYRVPVAWKENPMKFNRKHLPYPRLLEQRINGEMPDKNAEVIAMAVPGYSSLQGLAWLKREIEWLQPDIVTVSYGWNDTDYRRLSDKVSLPMERSKVIMRWLSAQSQAVIYASRWLRETLDATGSKSSAPPAELVSRVSSGDYVNNMLEIARVAKEHGAEPVIVAQVYQNAESNPRQAETITGNRIRLAKAAEAAGIPFLNIEELTEAAHPDNKHLFGELIHPNNLGHKLLADALYDFLVEHRLL